MITPFERFQEFVGEDGKLTERGATFLEEIVNVQDWQEVGVGNAPAFENSWAYRGGSHETPAYYKDGWGRVYLKGAIDSGTANTSAFTLPEDYRPPAQLNFTSHSIAITTTSMAVKILADGTVVPTAGSSNGVSLDGIVFRV